MIFILIEKVKIEKIKCAEYNPRKDLQETDKKYNEELEKIRRLKESKEKAKTIYQKNKYAKKIEFLKRELKFYCDNKGIDLKDIFK